LWKIKSALILLMHGTNMKNTLRLFRSYGKENNTAGKQNKGKWQMTTVEGRQEIWEQENKFLTIMSRKKSLLIYFLTLHSYDRLIIRGSKLRHYMTKHNVILIHINYLV
jgi:hypothetical protein